MRRVKQQLNYYCDFVKMDLLFIRLHILAAFLSNGEAQKLLCGPNIFSQKKYNPETHVCHNYQVIRKTESKSSSKGATHVNSTLLLKDRHSETGEPGNEKPQKHSNISRTELNTLVCGDNYVKYDTKTHKCENGTIVRIGSTIKPSTKVPVTHLPEKSKETSDNKSDDRGGFEILCRKLKCSGNIYWYCGNNGTYNCCGFQTYEPETQTCCRETSAKYRIYDNKPEINHICCGVYVYPRRKSEAPCQHSSRNDAFLSGKLPKMQKKLLGAMICNEDIQFAYHVRITENNSGEEEGYLKATVTQYKWQKNRSTSRRYLRRMKKKVGIKIPLDKYSPSRLWRKGFLILSNYQYLDDAIFFRHHGDVIFKAPKRKKDFLKKIGKVQAKCTIK